MLDFAADRSSDSTSMDGAGQSPTIEPGLGDGGAPPDLVRLCPRPRSQHPRTWLALGFLCVYLAASAVLLHPFEFLVLFWVGLCVAICLETLVVRPRIGEWTPRRPASTPLVVSVGLAIVVAWIVCVYVVAWPLQPHSGGSSFFDPGIIGAYGAGACFAVGCAIRWDRWYVAGPVLSLLFLAAVTALGPWADALLAALAAALFVAGAVQMRRIWTGGAVQRPPVAGREWDPASAAETRATRPDAFRDVMTSLYAVETADDVYLVAATGLSWPDLYRHLYWLETWGYLTASTWYRRQRLRASHVRLTPFGRREFGAWLEQVGAAA